MAVIVALLVAGGILLLGPTIVIVGSAFGTTGYLAFPPHGATLRWFGEALADPSFGRSILTSAEVATAVTASALLLGVPAAYALARRNVPGRVAFEAAFLLPLALPGIVLSIGLLVASSRAGLPPSLPRLAGAHLLVCMPCVIRVMLPAFRRPDMAIEQAARVHGASAVQAFFLVTMPLRRASIAAAAAISWIVSFDDFELALFHAPAATPTLPITLYGVVEAGAPPVVAAVCALLIAAALACAVLWCSPLRR